MHKRLLQNLDIYKLYRYLKPTLLKKKYCKDWLKRAKSDDERLMVYLELLVIYVSISLAKIRRLIEESVITYDHELFESLLPLISRKKKGESSKKTPENYTF